MTEFDAVDLAPTLEEAEAYFSARPRPAAWHGASTAERSQALAFAALVLESSFEFSETAFYTTGDREPRPRPRIVAAVCEQALWTLERGGESNARLASLGVTRASVGGLSATFDRRAATTLVCDAARRLIGSLGRFIALDDGGGEITSTPLAL